MIVNISHILDQSIDPSLWSNDVRQCPANAWLGSSSCFESNQFVEHSFLECDEPTYIHWIIIMLLINWDSDALYDQTEIG